MPRTYLLETDKTARQDNAATRQRSYFQPVMVVEPVEENGTVRIETHTLKLAHGYNEPKKVGNLERTRKRIWTANELERVYETNAKLLGLLMYEQRKAAQRTAKQARRHNFKMNRNLKTI